MLLFAASLLFVPHYEVTHAPEIGYYLNADAQANAYVLSATGTMDFLTKFDPEGNQVYRVSAGTSGQTGLGSVVADSAGNAYGLSQNAVTKFDPSGNTVFTYPLPNNPGQTVATAVAVGADGSIAVVGIGSPYPGFQTTPGAWVSSTQAAPNQANLYAIRLSAAGGLIYATFLDNSSFSFERQQLAGAVALDGDGDAYVAGSTSDPQFPTTPGAYQSQCCAQGGGSGFLLKLNAAGTALVYSTFLPGQFIPIGCTPNSIVPGPGGSVVLNAVNRPGNPNYGLLANSIQLNADGSNVVASATTPLYFAELAPNSFSADGQGNVLVTGQVWPSAPLPLAEDAFNNGSQFATLVRISDGAVLWATLLPYGAGAAGVVPDGSGGFLVLGQGLPDECFSPDHCGVEDPRPLLIVTRFTPASAPQPVILSVTNAAGASVSQGVAPGEIIAIYGTNLGPQTGAAATFQNGALPLDLSGVEVLMNGARSPVLYAAYDQVNAIVPFEVDGSATVTIQVEVNGALSNTAILPEFASEPAIFAVFPIGGSGTVTGAASALNEDGSINSQSNPAPLGSIVSIFVNGAGLQVPTPPDGTLAPFGPKPELPVSVQFAVVQIDLVSTFPCDVLYAGSAPEEIAGLLQVNFRLPGMLPEGILPSPQLSVQVTVGTQSGISNIWRSAQ